MISQTDIQGLIEGIHKYLLETKICTTHPMLQNARK